MSILSTPSHHTIHVLAKRTRNANNANDDDMTPDGDLFIFLAQFYFRIKIGIFSKWENDYLLWKKVYILSSITSTIAQKNPNTQSVQSGPRMLLSILFLYFMVALNAAFEHSVRQSSTYMFDVLEIS